ncbi:MAG TPA: type II toxin-antitoxin system VapC family toxin [Terracidiphilus sp.]|nr:type II toxin-antitoxin system VapC family toxin [Terracidiphilus sp.]
MKLLLDTHIVCWQFYEPRNLPKEARRLMLDAEAVLVSSASIWEIAIKVRIGKLNANPRRVVQSMEAAGFEELPVFSRHTVLVADLPLYHTDPFDRLLIAQAISEPLHLLTTDAQLKPYSELVILV